MRIVVALGGNALLRRGEPPDADIQETHVVSAVRGIIPLLRQHQLIITHGNSPQVGVLAVESTADPALSRPYPFDALGAQTQCMIGYWIAPVQMVELDLVKTLADAGAIVICAGGGGIPVTRDEAGGLHGVEAVLDKDLTAALLASAVSADALLILTDVPAVIRDYGTSRAPDPSGHSGRTAGHVLSPRFALTRLPPCSRAPPAPWSRRSGALRHGPFVPGGPGNGSMAAVAVADRRLPCKRIPARHREPGPGKDLAP